MFWIAAALVSLLVCVSSAEAQQIYKWKDEKGQWHFSQTPPAGVQRETVQGSQSQSATCRGELQAAKLDGAEKLSEKDFTGFTEKRLSELDCGRAEEAIYKGLAEVARDLARITRGDVEAKRLLLDNKTKACEKGALWRAELTKLESLVKARHVGLLPAWFLQDRNWRRLDDAAKKEDIRISPQECRQIYKK